MDPARRALLARLDAEERPTHGVRCKNCTLLLEHCRCRSKFPHLRSPATFQMLPPRTAATPYTLFFNQVSGRARQQHPSATTSEIADILSNEWMNLPVDQKQKYIRQARADEQRYEQEKVDVVRQAWTLQQTQHQIQLPNGKIVQLKQNLQESPRPAFSTPQTHGTHTKTSSSRDAPPIRRQAEEHTNQGRHDDSRNSSSRVKLPSISTVPPQRERPRSASNDAPSSSGRKLHVREVRRVDLQQTLSRIDSPTIEKKPAFSSRRVSLPKLAVEMVSKSVPFLDEEGVLRVAQKERPVLVEVSGPKVTPLDLNMFKSCHADDERPLMPSMRAGFVGHQYDEPLAPRTELTYPQIRFLESKREKELAETERRRKAAKLRSGRKEQKIFVNGVPCRKVMVGRFGRKMAGETLIFSIYQVGMDGRVYCAHDISEEDRTAPDATAGPRYFELNAYSPTTSRVYHLNVHVEEIIAKFGYEALELLKPGRKKHVVDRILGNLHFTDPEVPSRKALALASGTLDGTEPQRPSPPSLDSPRTKRRKRLRERRMTSKRNRAKLIMLARTINSQSFQVSVYQIPAYGACFYIVCYLPSTSCRYPIPVPYSELRGLMPDTRLAVESPDTWDNTTRTAIARELAARVSIRRIETKFDGVQCCACLGPGGCRRGVLGPDLPESRLFRSSNRSRDIAPFKKFQRLAKRSFRDILQLSQMTGPGNKVGGGVARCGELRRYCQFVVYKERENFMVNNMPSMNMRLLLYFPDVSQAFDVAFAYSDVATFFPNFTIPASVFADMGKRLTSGSQDANGTSNEAESKTDTGPVPTPSSSARRVVGTPSAESMAAYDKFARAMIEDRLSFAIVGPDGEPRPVPKSRQKFDKDVQIIVDRTVMVKHCELEVKAETKSAALGSIFDDDSDDEFDSDSASEDDSDDSANPNSEAKEGSEDGNSEPDSDAEDSDDDSDEIARKAARRTAKAEAKRKRAEATEISISADLEKAKQKEQKIRKPMMVHVHQQGQSFTFKALDLSQDSSIGSLSTTWCDPLSAALAIDLMRAPSEQRNALIEINLSSLYIGWKMVEETEPAASPNGEATPPPANIGTGSSADSNGTVATAARSNADANASSDMCTPSLTNADSTFAQEAQDSAPRVSDAKAQSDDAGGAQSRRGPPQRQYFLRFRGAM